MGHTYREKIMPNKTQGQDKTTKRQGRERILYSMEHRERQKENNA